MLIKITSINDAKMGNFDAKEIVGNKIEDGTEWRKSFFANNRKLGNELEEFGVGDNCNVKMKQNEKNPKFWDIIGFEEVSEAMLEKVRAGGGGYKATSAGVTKSGEVSEAMLKKVMAGGGGYKAKTSSLTKEEWAAKEAKKSAEIARAVALKAAIDFVGGKAKMTEEKLVESAKKFMPFLLGNESPFKEDGDDGLTPPNVD